MDETYEYTVMMRGFDKEPHTKVYGTFEEAQEWIQGAYDDDIPKAFDIWYVVERKVSGWYRVDE